MIRERRDSPAVSTVVVLSKLLLHFTRTSAASEGLGHIKY